MGLALNEQTILRSVHNVSSSEAVAVCDLKGKSLTAIALSTNAAVQFPNLLRLDLSDNAINNIENLKHLKQLKWLNLSNNRWIERFGTFEQMLRNYSRVECLWKPIEQFWRRVGRAFDEKFVSADCIGQRAHGGVPERGEKL